MSRPKLDWSKVDWSQTNAVIASELGTSRVYVSIVRKKVGAPPTPQRNRWGGKPGIDFSRAKGRRNPTAAAMERLWRAAINVRPLTFSMLGREEISLVKQACHRVLDALPEHEAKLSMNRRSDYDKVNWRKSDVEIAALLGVTKQAVAAARKQRGIPPLSHGGKRKNAGRRKGQSLAGPQK